MVSKNLKKGILCGVIGVFLISLQPIISNSRPSIIDPYIFATMSAIIQVSIFFPLYFLERKKLKRRISNFSEISEKIKSLLNGWKKKENILLIMIMGISFSAVPVLLYIGFELAGAILSSLALKSEIIFALLFGFLILKEKITKTQIFFSIILFIGLFIAISQGSFNFLEFNMGVSILIISVALFTLIHTLTKIGLDKNELFSTQIVFFRNLISGVILFFTYITIFPLSNLLIILDPFNFLFFVLMGLVYGFSLYFWYKTLSYIEIGKAGIINSATPIISAFFASIILGEIFTIYHLIGMIIVIFSIIMIVRQRKKEKITV
ncbi:MAG: DMT family transporter [Promethearchaeota archaeon]|nr:MAG: DMT family transporter [Candidatus Lokiarchaeota archaeon]